jgi:DeoR/GlpR family transcriptional regulator of sugar metabolism
MNRPLAVDRLDEIRRRLSSLGSVSVSQLATALKVSRETIRRDLKLLAELGDAEIVHGGATRRRVVEPGLAQRTEEQMKAKLLIAKRAARLLFDGATVLIDSGSTTLVLAEEIAMMRGITAATNSLGVATMLARSGHKVHLLGGEIDPNDEASMSAETIAALDGFSFDLAFIGVGGLSAKAGLTDYTKTAAQFRSRLIGAASQAYLLADASKFDRETPFPVAGADKVAGLVADRRPTGGLAKWFAERRISILLPDSH